LSQNPLQDFRAGAIMDFLTEVRLFLMATMIARNEIAIRESSGDNRDAIPP